MQFSSRVPSAIRFHFCLIPLLSKLPRAWFTLIRLQQISTKCCCVRMSMSFFLYSNWVRNTGSANSQEVFIALKKEMKKQLFPLYGFLVARTLSLFFIRCIVIVCLWVNSLAPSNWALEIHKDRKQRVASESLRWSKNFNLNNIADPQLTLWVFEKHFICPIENWRLQFLREKRLSWVKLATGSR